MTDTSELPDDVSSMQDDVVQEIVPDQPVENMEGSSWIRFPDGDSLDLIKTAAISKQSRVSIIIIAGNVGSGKTTLITSIYELFQNGPVAGSLFAGSYTLPGFERRCHLSRITSENTTPDTERTFFTDDTLMLHLRVANLANADYSRDLLFTDIAGERFRLLKDSTEECQNFPLLERADHFVLLLDGHGLSNLETRNQTYADCRSLLLSCIDSGRLKRSTFVDIVTTKWDLLYQSSDSTLQRFLLQIKKYMKKDFSHKVARLRFINVASRPNPNTLPMAYNVDKCFKSWVIDIPIRSNHNVHRPDIPLSREIDRFTFVTKPGRT